MTTHDFALWLHGYTELTGGAMPTEAQWQMIVEHLDLAFNKVTKPLQVQAEIPARPIGQELKQKLVDHAREQANQTEVARRVAQKVEQAQKAEQAEKDAQTQRDFAERLNDVLNRAKEAEKKRKEYEQYKDAPQPSPFFPHPRWAPDPAWPGGIAYKHPGTDPKITLTC